MAGWHREWAVRFSPCAVSGGPLRANRQWAADALSSGHRPAAGGGYGAQVAQIAATLAVHFERGCDPGRAVRYRPGQENAAERHAHHRGHRARHEGMSAARHPPETPVRAQQELDLLLALGPALMYQGPAAPEVDQTYARARRYAHRSASPQLFPTLRAWRFYLNRGLLPTARELGEQLLGLAQGAAAPTSLPEAHAALGTTFYVGEYVPPAHIEQGFTSPISRRSRLWDSAMVRRVRCLAVAAWTLWCLGLPPQALQRGQEALAQAQAFAHPIVWRWPSTG